MRFVVALSILLSFESAILARQHPHGLTIPLAGPNGFHDEEAWFNPNLLKRHNAQTSQKHACGAVTHNMSRTSNALSSQSRSNSKRAPMDVTPGSVPLAESGGSLWFGTVIVGVNPLTAFRAQFDSGSSDIVSFGENCTAKNCEGLQRYNARSERSRALGKRFQIRYGSDSISEKMTGMQYTDNVYVGGLLVNDQIIGVADTWMGESSEPYSQPDIIFGLGFRSNSRLDRKRPSFLETLYRAGQISEMMFAYTVGGLGGTQPQVTLGFADPALYQGDVTWLPVVGKRKADRWIVPLQGLGVGEKTLPFNPMNVMVDTGATFIHASASIAQVFYSKVHGAVEMPDILGQGMWSVPCKAIPWAWFKFGNTAFLLRPEHFTVKTVGTDGRTYCVGGIVVDTFAPGDFDMLLGNIFLRNVYSIFHYNESKTPDSYPQLGLAALRDSSIHTGRP